MNKLETILKDSAYKLAQFSPNEIAAVEEKIYYKVSRGKDTPFIKCLIREREIQLKPEEVIRQLFIYKLLNFYGYPKNQIQVERGVNFGREVKRADIVIMEKDRPEVEYIIVEVKKPNLKDGKEQLRSYCNATGATMGVWTNGNSISFYHRKDPNYFEDIPNIPHFGQKLKDILTKRWTIQDLIEKDKLATENKSLKDLILEMEDEVLANAGVDVFEEVFKLIYTKLYDEKLSANNKSRFLQFRNYGETDAELKDTIQEIFDAAQKKWAGVFDKDNKLKLTPSHLAICISSLQNVKLFNSNLEVIDEAFEYLMSKSQKGEKGQYFTPRYVIDMCVKMLNPKENEFMIDTAAGSCGFPVHTIFHVWKKFGDSELFTAEDKPPQFVEYVQEKIFAIDFDEKAVRVARTLNLIAGDGKTNVLWLNTLDYERWNEYIDDEDWKDIYDEGWGKLRKLRAVRKENRDFNFDILMANPPFAGDIKESRLLHKYELAKKSDGTYQSKMSRDVLFIERNLQFLKPGGRMAIVLPQGRFNNSSDKYIRDFIAERCRILAVVGLHGNVFKPHTGTKTSVLFVQKWDDNICPRRDDYPIFFATMQKPSKDNSGDKIYCTTAEGVLLRDAHNHLIVDHDLFNHNGLTQDGIAEAFIEFAKKEKLSFFDSSSFNEQHYNRLLEELECTEIFLSEIKSGLFRLEAEFYQKKYLALEKKLSANLELGQFAKKIECGPFGSNLLDTEYLPDGVLVVRPFNLKNLVVENDNLVYISENLVAENNLKIYKRNTLLFSRVGDIKIGILNRDAATISPNIIAVELKNPNLAKFFAVFFNTYAGFTQIARQLKVSAQPTISTDIIKNLKVFVNDKIVSSVIEIFDSAQNKLIQANETYRAAENILAQELHLQDFKPSTKNTAVISFSASFGKTGRLDAEFYQPKYEDLENFLAKFETTTIPNEFEIFKNSGTNYAGGVSDVAVIKTKQVTNQGVNIDGVESYFDYSACVENRNTFLKKNDVIFASMGVGSLGKSSLFFYDGDKKFVTDSTLKIYRAKKFSKIQPAVLNLFLQSKIAQEIIYRYVVGSTGIINIYDSDIAKIPVPIIPMATQEKISALVEKSFALRAESKRLLEVAKLAVEIAIERGEIAATEYLRRGENFGD